MSESAAGGTRSGADAIEGATPYLWLSVATALLAALGSVVALAVPRIYAGLTPAFLPQALAQDIANLAVAAPAMILLAWLAMRGSLRAYLLWLGVLVFTVYNYVIYTFAVPFGPLFLLWVAVLGLCLFALIGGVTRVDHEAVADAFTDRRAIAVVGWLLIVTAVLFCLLWLSEDVPALLAGTTPASVRALGIPTNLVHVLDFAFFLPAVSITGIGMLRCRAFSCTVAPAFLVFLVLTGVPILLTPVVQSARGEVAEWGVAIPIGTLVVVLAAAVAWLIATVRPAGRATSAHSFGRYEAEGS